jgi:hypothetical protein
MDRAAPRNDRRDSAAALPHVRDAVFDEAPWNPTTIDFIPSPFSLMPSVAISNGLDDEN